MDIKVLQYLMGHSSIDITMQVYNHITDMSRVKNEVVKMDEAVNAWKKNKNWCQIGVKQQKWQIFKKLNARNPQ